MAGSAFDLPSAVLSLQYEARSTNTILGVADRGKVIDITAAITQTFEADETLGDGWYVYLRNATDEGTVVVTLDPAGSETIDGLTPVTMYSGEMRLIACNGAGGNFTSVLLSGGFARFIADGTFVVPHGITKVSVDAIGAGGSGAAGNTSNGGSGGGGGHRTRQEIAASALGNPGDSITVNVGVTTTGPAAPNSGTVGENTTFGALVTAFGGGAGFGSVSAAFPGTGGGAGEAGLIGAGSNQRGGGAYTTAMGGHGEIGGGVSASTAAGFPAEYGGAAGGGSGVAPANGGTSTYGGGGGGGSSNATAAGRPGGDTGIAILAGGGGGAAGASGAGGHGSDGAPGDLVVCGQGGGSGGSVNGAGTGGNGGHGGAPGGGGGAGGRGNTAGGAGGNGGRGECRVFYE